MFMINDEGVWLIKRPQGREDARPLDPDDVGQDPARLVGGVYAANSVGAIVGAAGELVRRAPGYRTSLLLWAVLAWGSLLYAVVTGVATDYPRFATVILAPLEAAGGDAGI